MSTSNTSAAAAEIAAVVDWAERTFGGRVTLVERLRRWRASWYLTVESGAGARQLYVRGARVSGFLAPFPLTHELAVHRLLEAHDVPVPHAYDVIDGGPIEVMVMDRLPG